MTYGLLGLILGGPAAGAAIGVYFGRRFGFRQGCNTQEIETDHLNGEIHDLNQRIYALSKQMQQLRRAAA